MLKPFAGFLADLKRSAPAAVHRTADGLAADARQSAPVDDGELRDSITVTDKGQTVEVTAGSDHAAYVEFGTVDTPAQPFWVPSLARARKRLNRELQLAVSNAKKVYVNPSLAFQKALRARLVASSKLTALVPASSIIDAHGRPARFPCIIVGEGGDEPERIAYAGALLRASAILHVWTEETGLQNAKAIAGAIAETLDDCQPEGFRRVDWRLGFTRYLRDPSGKHAHAVIESDILLERLA